MTKTPAFVVRSLEEFFGNAVYGDNLSCVLADERTRWAEL